MKSLSSAHDWFIKHMKSLNTFTFKASANWSLKIEKRNRDHQNNDLKLSVRHFQKSIHSQQIL